MKVLFNWRLFLEIVALLCYDVFLDEKVVLDCADMLALDASESEMWTGARLLE